MEAVRGVAAKLAEHREKVISLLLLGSSVALGVRSSEQQREIDALESQKSALRAANASMSAAMWAWRLELFALAATPSPPISAARLRAIYGEDDPPSPSPAAATAAEDDDQTGVEADAEDESVSIA